MTTNPNDKHNKTSPLPSKIAQSKIYEYIRKIEIDGLPRVRAYAETIDPDIYQLPPDRITYRLDAIRTRGDYEDIKNMVLAEQEDWILRRSAVIQDKAVGLLANLIDKANELATKPDADVKELNTAVATLRTIMPAFGNTPTKQDNTSNRKARAGKYIN